MERQEIEAFLALSEELHFGRAATRLGLSTARVSQLIRVLERRIGRPLFDRTSRSVRVTPAGRRLSEEIRPAYEQMTAAYERAVADGRGLAGVLRVGFVGAAAGHRVVRAAAAFQRRNPGSGVRVREVQIGGALQHLRNDEIDLLYGCLPLAGPGLTAGPVLLSERRMLAVAVDHPYAKWSSVRLEDLVSAPMVAAPCSLPGPARGPAAETFQEVLTLVGAGQGGFLVGEHATRFHGRPDIAYVPVVDAPPLDWGPVWQGSRSNARLRAFVDACATQD